MKKLIFFVLVALNSKIAMAEVVISQDVEKNCKIHRATSAEAPIQAGETSIDGRVSYGFTLKNLVVDFEQKAVYVNVINRIIFGFDRTLTGKPVMIKSSNPEFQSLINHLNFSIRVFNQVCLTENNELIYALPDSVTIHNQER